MIYGAVYSIFTGIYYVASDGIVIYTNVLDYGEELGRAVGTVVGVTLVFIPLVHMIFYLQYFVKFWILYYIFGRKQNSEVNNVDLEESKQKNEVI